MEDILMERDFQHHIEDIFMTLESGIMVHVNYTQLKSISTWNMEELEMLLNDVLDYWKEDGGF